MLSKIHKHWRQVIVFVILLVLIALFRNNINWTSTIPQVSYYLILVYLGKLLIEKYTTISIEKIKSQTELENKKTILVYSRLHSQRAIVIKKLYRYLTKSVNSLISLTKPPQEAGEPDKKKKILLVYKTYNKFVTYYDQNKIYFDKNLCVLIDSFIDALRDPILDYKVYYPAWEQSLEAKDSKNAIEYHKELRNAWKKVESNITPIKEKLENEFRQIIGVTTQ